MLSILTDSLARSSIKHLRVNSRCLIGLLWKQLGQFERGSSAERRVRAWLGSTASSLDVDMVLAPARVFATFTRRHRCAGIEPCLLPPFKINESTPGLQNSVLGVSEKQVSWFPKGFLVSKRLWAEARFGNQGTSHRSRERTRSVWLSLRNNTVSQCAPFPGERWFSSTSIRDRILTPGTTLTLSDRFTRVSDLTEAIKIAWPTHERDVDVDYIVLATGIGVQLSTFVVLQSTQSGGTFSTLVLRHSVVLVLGYSYSVVLS